MTAEDIADTIWWVATLPPHLNINALELMPVSQSWAGFAVIAARVDRTAASGVEARGHEHRTAPCRTRHHPSRSPPPRSRPMSPRSRPDGLLHISGQISFAEDGSLINGRLGEDVDLEGRAGRRAPLRHHAARADEGGARLARPGRADRQARRVRQQRAGDFTDQPKVANGASELMQEVFGEAGRHARSAVGVPVLPLGVAVEVDAIVAVKA